MHRVDERLGWVRAAFGDSVIRETTPDGFSVVLAAHFSIYLSIYLDVEG